MVDAAIHKGQARLNSLTKGDVRAVLAKRHPAAPASDVSSLAEIITTLYDVLAALPKDKRLAVTRSKRKLRLALLDAAARSDPASPPPVEEAVETSAGTGLGEFVDLDEGRSRVDSYAIAKPLEAWAGPVAGAGKIHEELGIKHSTLGAWYKRGAVIGLLRGERKLAYPLEQFVDARPLEGVAAVLRVIGDPRAAWLWMRQPHGALEDLTPLQSLRAGRVELVSKVAERDFV